MYRHIPQRRAFGWADLMVLSGIAVLIYGLVGLAQQWTGTLQYYTEIDLSPMVLPKYSFFSLMRAVTAYFISLVFSLIYGYMAAKSKLGERILIPILDILQCIPVLGFLPSVVLGLAILFPNQNLGLELACILMIFTSQAWNMTFSLYSSVRSVPADLRDVSEVIRLSWYQRVKRIELPFSAIGLAWNSLMSMAGGWFFLTVCESFTLGDKKFQLPGIGSYMAVAIERGDDRAMVCGLTAMFLMIIFVDFLIWRPVMAWVRKFQMEEIPEDVAELPFVTTLLRESFLVEYLRRRLRLISRRRTRHLPTTSVEDPGSSMNLAQMQVRRSFQDVMSFFQKHRVWTSKILSRLATPAAIAILFWGGTRLWELVRTLTLHDWKVIWGSVGLTFVRVAAATILGSIWTIPVGILIGLSPRLTRFFQPIIQVIAAFPAPMIFPLIIAVMIRLGIGIHWGSAILMMLGVQWYVLFNVLAGAMSVTRELKDSMTLIGVSQWTRWWKLYLPAAFPALVPGWVTAAGGAWNASIVAEYLHYKGHILIAPGIGSLISRATADANFPLLAGCLIAMVLAVVGLNQTLWRWLNELAETKFRFER